MDVLGLYMLSAQGRFVKYAVLSLDHNAKEFEYSRGL